MNVLKQRDPSGMLIKAAQVWEQAASLTEMTDIEHDRREIRAIVIAGMGGSALSGKLLRSLLAPHLTTPLEVIHDYTLPKYVSRSTLVIACSYSGNTEETVAMFEDAITHHDHPQLAVISSGGVIAKRAEERHILHAHSTPGQPPRMVTIAILKALLEILEQFGCIDSRFTKEVTACSDWLRTHTEEWVRDSLTSYNLAKQLALLAVGKTPLFHAGPLMAPLAYKWKTSWNENAKNLAFTSTYPESSHNELLGWTSHPIEKPFVIFDLVSRFEHPRTSAHIALTDKLLSGRRPKSHSIELEGDSIIRQMLWGCILAEFASIYTAILNGVNPERVDLIDRFKTELG